MENALLLWNFEDIIFKVFMCEYKYRVEKRMGLSI